jgi:hypothetical protein
MFNTNKVVYFGHLISQKSGDQKAQNPKNNWRVLEMMARGDRSSEGKKKRVELGA